MSSPKRLKFTPKEDNNTETEYIKSLHAIARCQDEIECMQDKYDQEVLKLEQKLEIDKRPVYTKREEAICKIPNFWVTALLNHPDISSMLHESEEDYLLHVSRIEVQIIEENEHSFKITFYFKENPYFKNNFLSKEYFNVSTDKSIRKITVTPVCWKDGQDISEKIKERKSFLYWLTSQEYGSTDFDIAQVIKEDLWMNPLPYYLLTDSDHDDDSEDDEETDDVVILEDSDDEKSTIKDDEEDSDIDSEDYESPASSEVTQNDN